MSWYQQARCNRHDPEIFFDTRKRAERRAKSICSKCAVQRECLAFALQSGTEFGVWGGLNADERRMLLLRMKRSKEIGEIRPAAEAGDLSQPSTFADISEIGQLGRVSRPSADITA